MAITMGIEGAGKPPIKSPETSRHQPMDKPEPSKTKLSADTYLHPKVVRLVERGEVQGRGPVAALARIVYHIAVRLGKAEQALAIIERVLHAHFAEGKPLGVFLPHGEIRFGKKTEAQQGFFFKNSLPFTCEKKGKMEEVRKISFRDVIPESLVPLRRHGFLKGAPVGEKTGKLLVCDLQFQQGQERFARIPIGNPGVLGQILARLVPLVPGSFLERALLQQWTGGQEFTYLALSHKVVRPDLAVTFKSAMTESAEARSEGVSYGREGLQGIALSARTEQLIAQQLDLNLRAPSPAPSPSAIAKITVPLSRRGERVRKRAGEKEPEEYPVFVPWYQLVWRPRKWKGKIKWYVILTYFVLASVLGFGGYFAYRFLLQ